MSDKLHDCKRGLAVATSRDYNDWWRERERLRAEVSELKVLWRIRDDLMEQRTAALARVETLEGAVHSARSFILPWTSDCDYTAESDLKYACEILLAATEGESNNDQD